jgi:hypothetical protein
VGGGAALACSACAIGWLIAHPSTGAPAAVVEHSERDENPADPRPRVELMDVSGAAALRLRIEHQEHWRLAAAVRDGRQPGVDPDMEALREVRGVERIYDAGRPFVKRLIGGAWKRIEVASAGPEKSHR